MMIEVLVTTVLACGVCGAWAKAHFKNKAFHRSANVTDRMLEDFMVLNDIEKIDFQLFNPDDLPKMQKKYIEGNIIEWIAKEIDKGYDFYRMRMPKGYNSLNHRHNFSDEFFYVLDGSIYVNHSSGQVEQLSGGEYAFIKKSNFHSVIATEDSDVIVIAKPSLVRRS